MSHHIPITDVYVIRVFLFLTILTAFEAKAQISYYEFKETDQIVIHAQDTSKNQVYIFLDVESQSQEKAKLQFLLSTKIVDFSNFEFHVLNMTLMEGCSRKQRIQLYNYNNLKFEFAILPFCWLVDVRGNDYNSLKFNRVSTDKWNSFTRVLDLDDELAPFEMVNDLSIIEKLFFVTPESLQQIGNLSQISSDSKTQGKLIDSLQNELEKTNTKLQRSSSFIRMDLMPFPLSFPSLREGNTKLGHTMRQASWAVQVCKFPFEFNEDFGWISSLGYSSLSGNFSIASRVDTVNKNAKDPDGESYIRIAKLNNLSESYSLINLNFQLAPIYRWRTENGTFSVYSGIGLNLATSSQYKSTSGSVTYYGIYPQYSSTETSFDGKYDFGKESAVNGAMQELQMQKYSISWISGVDYVHRLGKYSPLSAGLGLRYASSKVKLSEFNDNGIQVQNANVYSSGLYNYTELGYRQLNMSLIVSYSIN